MNLSVGHEEVHDEEPFKKRARKAEPKSCKQNKSQQNRTTWDGGKISEDNRIHVGEYVMKEARIMSVRLSCVKKKKKKKRIKKGRKEIKRK